MKPSASRERNFSGTREPGGQFDCRGNLARVTIPPRRPKSRSAPRDALPMTTAAIRRLAIPSADELVERAAAMGPEDRALAEETERSRNLAPQIVEKFRDAELLRTCRPRMFGGFEYDGEVALKIALTISAACASSGWTVNGAVSNGYSLAHWPIEAQRELWEGDADPFTFACFAPTGTAIPAEGGYRLSGQWSLDPEGTRL